MATEIFLLDDKGNKIALLSDFVSVDYAFVKNQPGPVSLLLPGPSHSLSNFGRDYRLQIERDGVIEGETQFLIRRRDRILNRRGEKLWEIGGFTAMHLLDRRGIAYYSGSNQADRTDNADDLMKALVRDNLGADAQNGPHVTGSSDNLRDLAAPDLSAYFTVAADTGTVASTNKAASRKQLLTTLQEIADDAWEAGTWLGFDVVLNSSDLFEFRTYVGQRGDDHSSSSGALVLFSPERGNLVDVRRTWDWTQEITVAIAAGQNTAASRAVATDSDSSRTGASIFNWIERVADARHVSTTPQLQAEARQALQDGLPRDILTARIQDTPGTKRNTHWGYGDIVSIEFEGETFDARIDGLKVGIDQGGFEAMDVALRVDV